MALSVQPIRKRKITGVGYNYGYQGSKQPIQDDPKNTPRAQKSAPSTTVQNGGQTAPQAQPRTSPTYYSPQNAAPTPAQVRAAAEAKRQAVILKIKQEKAQKKKVAQKKLTVKVNQNEAKFKKGANAARNVLAVQDLKKRQDIHVKSSRFDQKKHQAFLEAQALVDATKETNHTKGLSNWWDKATFGEDRRGLSARDYAQQQRDKLQNEDIPAYDEALGIFQDEQASRKAHVEGKKFSTQAEYEAAVKEYTEWEDLQIQQLEDNRARITGMLEGYNMKASEKLNSTAARAAGFARNELGANPVSKAAGQVWKYTLGEGSENIPSLVTAPSRLVNLAGNLNTKDRDINKYGGETENRTTSGKNAWQSTYNQRNINAKPYVDKPFDRQQAEKEYPKAVYENAVRNRQADESYEDWLVKMWDRKNEVGRLQNSALELVADPLNFAAGAGAVVRGAKKTARGAKWLSTAKASKFGTTIKKGSSFISNANKAVKENSLIKWLGADAKSPKQQLNDAIDVARQAQGAYQEQALSKLKALNKKLAKNEQLDLSVFDDFAKLSESEIKILQRMVDGRIVRKDRLILFGKGNEPIRNKLEGIAQKWNDFSEQMKLADGIEKTRFGKGGRTYSPATAWLDGDLNKYNFRKRSSGKIQSKDEFIQGATDRYFKSAVDDAFANEQTANKAKWLKSREDLLQQYDQKMGSAREGVIKAERKANSATSKVRGIFGAPQRVWKKSVLKYNPPWTVNNIGYNVPGAVLSGGWGAASEQVKLLNPNKWRKALDELPKNVTTDLVGEYSGKGRLDKFYNRVENHSRVAAFRAAKKKGLTDDAAIKRVNKYLLDYKTKNWERPIKSVVPFWSFQKGLTKAAVQMPFDRPRAAIAYNRIDKYQEHQFDQEFAQFEPQLKELGYTDQQIQEIKTEQQKYYKGRLKVGDKWINTPFNAFSEKGLSNMGINPYIAAAGEASLSVDNYNQTTSGSDSGLIRRLASKFPQLDLGIKAKQAYDVEKGYKKPIEKWIGEAGTSGYGLTKERQGYDDSLPNYSPSMDPRSGLKDKSLAFLGVPKGLKFDGDRLVESKKLQKATSEYFATDFSNLDFEESQKITDEMLAKYGMTQDDFFKGVLSKYDSDKTKEIKGLKEDAKSKNQKLFDEYGAQPKGTRNAWATKKLKELVDSGYFKQNPFLRSFDWADPTTVAKGERQNDYSEALASGNWSAYEAKHGVSEKKQMYRDAIASGDWSAWTAKYGKSEKALAYDEANKTGDWTGYNKKYGKSEKAQAYEDAKRTNNFAAFHDKYGDNRSDEDKAKAKEAKFWQKYYELDSADRSDFLKANPEFDRRKDWTSEQWNKWKRKKKAETLAYLKSDEKTAGIFSEHLVSNKIKGDKFVQAQINKRLRSRAVSFKLS